MTAMDTQQVVAPSSQTVMSSTSPPPPTPPPPPGCYGGVQMPHWRSESAPTHLAPTKEEIDREQYARLPDKLITSMNKDKKPFTYTPSGVSGVEKGKLDLSSIRSPRMKKRLLANMADEEVDPDQYESERVTRSETPDLLSKPTPVHNNRRAVTPDMTSANKQMFAPVLPPIDLRNGRESPLLQKQLKNSLPNDEFDALIKKQMKEMEKSLKNQKKREEEVNGINGLEPEVQQLIDSYANKAVVPTRVESSVLEPTLTKHYPECEPAVELPVPQRLENNVNIVYERQESKGKKNGIYSRSSDRNDSKRDINCNDINNNDNSCNLWESDLLKHVLEGGLQEEIEKFEKISLETQQSFTPKRDQQNLHTFYETPTFETFGRQLPNPSPVWSPPSSQYQDNGLNTSYKTHGFSPYGSLNRNANRNDNRSPQPYQTGRQRVWSESPCPSPHSYFDRETASAEPSAHTGVNIPNNHYMRPRADIPLSEVTNYNCRPKPFYLCPPTPTPPQYGSQQQHQHPIQRPKESEGKYFTTFGKNISPQKVNYFNENSFIGMNSSPQTPYINQIGMYAQTSATDGWEGAPNQSHTRPLDRNIKFSDRIITSPERTGFKSPEPPKPILKKKLPPSERPPDPTPSKYMGANIPSRSFRVLQLMTGEDIDNQFITDGKQKNGFEGNVYPNRGYKSSKQSNNTNNYSNYEDFGTDF